MTLPCSSSERKSWATHTIIPEHLFEIKGESLEQGGLPGAVGCGGADAYLSWGEAWPSPELGFLTCKTRPTSQRSLLVWLKKKTKNRKNLTLLSKNVTTCLFDLWSVIRVSGGDLAFPGSRYLWSECKSSVYRWPGPCCHVQKLRQRESAGATQQHGVIVCMYS